MNTRITVLFVIAALLTGCASDRARTDLEAGQRYLAYAKAPVDRFTAFDIDGWTSVSRTQLVVWARFDEAYLLTVWDNCPELQYAHAIRLSSTGSTVSKFDYVQVGRDRCQITEIRPVDIKQKKADERAMSKSRGSK